MRISGPLSRQPGATGQTIFIKPRRCGWPMTRLVAGGFMDMVVVWDIRTFRVDMDFTRHCLFFVRLPRCEVPHQSVVQSGNAVEHDSQPLRDVSPLEPPEHD